MSVIDKTCRLITLGCKVNQYETQLVKETLEQNGFREVSEGESADLSIVNSCTVTGEADAKGRQLIRQLAKQNPQGKTIVMGCYATRDPQAVAALPNVVEVVTDKRELPDLFQRLGIDHQPRGISHFDGHQRAFVKVQDGCLLRCTYCIIPHVRPQLRSRDPEDIVEEVTRLIDHGHREIVLCGIHLGHYGVERTRGRSGLPPFRLAHLIQKLNAIPGNWRLRLSSIEAAEVDQEFIDIAADAEHLVPHFHPSLQSGSNEVLSRMRRRYRVGRFLEKLELFRRRMHLPAFSTDVIVGFPGETEREFQETLRVCRDAGFMKIHIFPFSPRKGTPAAQFPDQIPAELRKDRCQRLAELESELARAYGSQLVGQEVSVLVERRSEQHPKNWRGTACRYATVELSAPGLRAGELVRARVERVLETGVSACLLENAS